VQILNFRSADRPHERVCVSCSREVCLRLKKNLVIIIVVVVVVV